MTASILNKIQTHKKGGSNLVFFTHWLYQGAHIKGGSNLVFFTHWLYQGAHIKG